MTESIESLMNRVFALSYMGMHEVRNMNIPAVYAIFHRDDPTQQYVGSTFDFGKRMQNHYTLLLSGLHDNHGIRKIAKKTGGTGFLCHILESPHIDDLGSRERFWIHKVGTLNSPNSPDRRQYGPREPKCMLCDSPRIKGMKYCRACKQVVARELRTSGYMAPWPRDHKPRTSDQKENTYETKWG